MIKKLITAILAINFIFSTLSITAFASNNLSGINAEAYIVMDAASGQVLVEKNSNQRMAPASITKIMTVALGLDNENANMDDMFTVSRETAYSIVSGSTSIALVPGEVISFRDAILATQLISANDAANAVAQYDSGSLEAFVNKMNAKVSELGLTGTMFANPNGLDEENHYVTAYDMAVITQYALTVPGFREVFAETEYQMPETNIKERWYFYAQNAIMFPSNDEYYEGITGSKLGYTPDAGHTIVATAKQGDMELIMVALDAGKSQKFVDAQILFDYCFSNYELMTISSAEIASELVPISSIDTPTAMANIHSDNDHHFVVPIGTLKSDLTITYNTPDYYVSERRIEPELTVFSAAGTQIYSAPLNYTLFDIAADGSLIEPTSQLSRQNALFEFLFVCLQMIATAFVICIALLFNLRVLKYTRYVMAKQKKAKKKEKDKQDRKRQEDERKLAERKRIEDAKKKREQEERNKKRSTTLQPKQRDDNDNIMMTRTTPPTNRGMNNVVKLFPDNT